MDFPERWPGFFTELVALLAGGEGPADMFCRVLVAIDEDVVSLDIPRSPEGVRASMALKARGPRARVRSSLRSARRRSLRLARGNPLGKRTAAALSRSCYSRRAGRAPRALLGGRREGRAARGARPGTRDWPGSARA